MVNVYGLLG